MKNTGRFENKQALFWLFAANTISGAAQGISLIAIPWYFIDIVRKPGVFSLFYGILTLTSMLWVIYAGALIDRYNRQRLFQALCVISGVLITSMAYWSSVSGVEQFLPALVVLAITVLNFNLHYPTLYAFAQEITDKTRYSKIVSYMEIQGQATSVLSGALAAILLKGNANGEPVNVMGFRLEMPFTLEAWSLSDIFFLDGITYFVALLCVSLIRYVPQTIREIEEGSAWARIRSGFAYLRTRPMLLLFGILSYGVFISVTVEDKILLPEYVRTHLGSSADVYASASVWFAIGALLSGVITHRLFRRWHPPAAVSFLFVFIGLVYLGCVWSRSVAYLYGFSLLYGYANTGVRILRVSYLFTQVPNAMIGRMLSFLKMADTAIRSLFIALFALPWFHLSNNIRFGYLIFGIFIIVCGLIMIPTLKSLARSPQNAS